MEEKKVKLNVDVEQSVAGLKELKKQLKNTAAGTAEFKELYGAIDDLEDKIKSAKNTSSDWIDSMENSGGVLGMVGGAINKVKVATQTFGGALKATGIGIIVMLLGGLVAAFHENDNAMKKIQPILNAFSKIFQGVFKAVEPLVDILINMALNALPMVMNAVGEVYSYVSALAESFGAIGRAIYKLVTGDFKGAWAEAKSSVTDFSKHHDEAKAKYISGTKEMTEADKEAAAKAKEAREKAEAEAEKLAAKKKAREEKEAAEKAKRLKEAIELEKAIREGEIEDRKKLFEDFDKINADKVAADTARETDAFAVTKANYENDKTALADAENAKIELRNKGLDNLTAGIEVLKSIAGKNKVIQKGLLMAEAAVNIARIIGNTMAGNAKTVATMGGPASIPFVAMNNIGMGIGIASTIAATAKGLAALGGGGAPTAGAVPGATPGGGGGAPQFNVIGSNATNQLAQTIGNRDNMPVKAYVVAADVTGQQDLDRKIKQTATMGG